jgi:hypothetical protein
VKFVATLVAAILVTNVSLCAVDAQAQTKLAPVKWTQRYNDEEATDLGLWPQSLNTFRYKRWAVEVDNAERLQYRISRLNEIQLRAFVGYRSKPWLNVWFGTYPYASILEPRYVDEQRTLEQIGLEKGFKRCAISLRSRLEQRYFSEVHPAQRIREMPRFDYFINPKRGIYVYVGNEFFLNLNTVSPRIRQGYAQNRLQTGIGIQLQKHVRVEVAYLNQWLRRHYEADDPPDRINHNILLQMFTNF